MKKKEEKILNEVFEEFTGYWDEDDALQYTPVLFPFVEPNEKVKDAIKALSCKKEKNERFRESRSAVEVVKDYHRFLRELEHIVEDYNDSISIKTIIFNIYYKKVPADATI